MPQNRDDAGGGPPLKQLPLRPGVAVEILVLDRWEPLDPPRPEVGLATLSVRCSSSDPPHPFRMAWSSLVECPRLGGGGDVPHHARVLRTLEEAVGGNVLVDVADETPIDTEADQLLQPRWKLAHRVEGES
jgi:hypothetical protein